MTSDPADFYTGLVADLYTPLKGSHTDPQTYIDFVKRHGEPALELGCGDGDPLLDLRLEGLEVDGIDSSPDMIEKCLERAATFGVDVRVEVQRFETLEMHRKYKSIYLAGRTFNLLPDDETALAALRRLRAHLDEEGGVAFVPLFIPDPIPEEVLGQYRESTDAQGRTIRFAVIAVDRNDGGRTQTSTLRYERIDGDKVEAIERDWVIHWWSTKQFASLVATSGLRISSMSPNDPKATAFAARLTVAKQRR